MIDFLLGVPGKLKTISDYLAGTIYPYITSRTANLDTTISSRAAASSALTNATWTDTRAAKLDQISAPLINAAPIAANFGVNIATTTSATYATVLSITGSGIINAVGAIGHASSGSAYLQLIIDGVTVVTDAIAPAGGLKFVIGSGTGSTSAAIYGLDQIPFKTSLVINLHSNTANAVTAFWMLRRAT